MNGEKNNSIKIVHEMKLHLKAIMCMLKRNHDTEKMFQKTSTLKSSWDGTYRSDMYAYISFVTASVHCSEFK